ncbi:hypothetical protein Barb6_01997 [Bacteroidales bacterium Barb6]|nr:hypothetical protein Barb6_01997 [Bacteroidales bacterium Barb6]
MEKRVIEALVHLGISRDWLLTGNGDMQINNVTDSSGITGVQGCKNSITSITNLSVDVKDLRDEVNTLKESVGKTDLCKEKKDLTNRLDKTEETIKSLSDEIKKIKELPQKDKYLYVKILGIVLLAAFVF